MQQFLGDGQVHSCGIGIDVPQECSEVQDFGFGWKLGTLVDLTVDPQNVGAGEMGVQSLPFSKSKRKFRLKKS